VSKDAPRRLLERSKRINSADVKKVQLFENGQILDFTPIFDFYGQQPAYVSFLHWLVPPFSYA
jgi:hypothetical protein